MVFKVTLFITLLILGLLFAELAGWVTQDSLVTLVYKVGSLSSVVAAFAWLFNK
jgi:hypothetical protein